MKLGLAIVMKYNVVRRYLEVSCQDVPINNYAMQQVLYKGGFRGREGSKPYSQTDR